MANHLLNPSRLLGLGLVAVAGHAQADCLPPLAGAIEATFTVQACRETRAPRPDRRRLLRFSASDVEVNARPVPTDDVESIASYDALIAGLAGRRFLYAEAVAPTACKDYPAGTRLVATVVVQCCDTLPQRGLCALPGPLVRPVVGE